MQTQELLPCAAVSRHFYSIITRAIHRRLLKAASLPRNELILECYHPSAKISTPYLSCSRNGITTLDEEPLPDQCERLSDLQRLYSSFRPVVMEENRRSWRFRTSIMNLEQEDGDESLPKTRPAAREDVYLDTGESFTQLCTVTNVVKEGPRSGLFVSHVNVSDGVVRVWREWLASRVMKSSEEDQNAPGDADRFLWADRNHDVGLRFRVSPGPSEGMLLVSNLDNIDDPVSYTLEYKGEVLECHRHMPLYQTALGTRHTDIVARALGPIITPTTGSGEVRGTRSSAFGQSHHHIVNVKGMIHLDMSHIH